MRAGTPSRPGTAAAASAGAINPAVTAASARRSSARDRAGEADADGAEHEQHGDRDEHWGSGRLDGPAARGIDEASQVGGVPPELVRAHTPVTTTIAGMAIQEARDRWAAATARPVNAATIPATGDARNASPAADPARAHQRGSDR